MIWSTSCLPPALVVSVGPGFQISYRRRVAYVAALSRAAWKAAKLVGDDVCPQAYLSEFWFIMGPAPIDVRPMVVHGWRAEVRGACDPWLVVHTPDYLALSVISPVSQGDASQD